MSKVIISIIVPIYNAEKYLPACLDSILVQTFKNFELLLINDASKDNSLKICNQYAGNDDRIRVFNQEINGGICVARNVGLDNAQGKYIVCIDADDAVLKNHLELLYYSPLIPEGTLVHANYLVEKNGNIVNKTENEESYFIENLFKEQCSSDFLFAGHACSKLIETAILRNNNLRYRLGIYVNEDHIFHLEYLMYVHAYKKVGEKTYIYFNRTESISKKHFSFEDCMERVDLMIPMTEKVLKRFTIEDHQVKIGLYFTPMNALISAIFALYRFPYRKNKLNRISCLDRVLTNYSNYINDFWKPQDSINRVIKNILLSKNLRIIDFCISAIIYVRYTIIENLKN